MKETDLQAVVATLFQRGLTEVETFPWDLEPTVLMGEIAAPLLELLNEDPDARELLRDRTFARSLH